MPESGVPANVNPFSVVQDEEICDGCLMNTAPQYFAEEKDEEGRPRFTLAPLSVQASPLSQREGEELVRRLVAADPVLSFAVKENFTHIIPEDLKKKVYVTSSDRDRCYSWECRKDKAKY